MVKIRIFSIILLFTFFSCNRSEDSNLNSNNDELLLKVIDSEMKRSDKLNDRVDFLISSSLFVSVVHLDTGYKMKDVIDKFSKGLNIFNEYYKSLNEELITNIEREYGSIANYSKTYSQICILDSNIENTINYLREGKNSDIKKMLSKNLYNTVLEQEILIMQFKFDSVLFESYESLNQKSKINPYYEGFIKKVPEADFDNSN